MDGTTLAERLGSRLQLLRKRQALTQEAAGEATTLAPNYISEVERGAKMPSIEALARLSKAYRVTMSECLAFVDQERPAQLTKLDEAVARLPPDRQLQVMKVVEACLVLAQNDTSES